MKNKIKIDIKIKYHKPFFACTRHFSISGESSENLQFDETFSKFVMNIMALVVMFLLDYSKNIEITLNRAS